MKNRIKAVICDIDETLIQNKAWDGDLDRFYLQLLDGNVIHWCYEVLHALHAQGYKIIFLTARNENFRHHTELQLRNMLDFPFELYMRGADDLRHDWEIKQDYMEELVKRHDILFCLDDNKANCNMFQQYAPSLHIVT